MVFNSIGFLLFFVVVFAVYYLPIGKKNSKFQNSWLFLTSYFFYGYADWKMIPLLLGATVVFYGIGLWLRSEMDKGFTRRASSITTLGVILGVGVLFYFKYLNFFAESFARVLESIGLNVSWTTLNIVLPIGVSFFTFKLISYVIEIHREHIQPCKDFIEFGTYIAFFPTILSGPIDRPNKFLPQLGGARLFRYDLAVDGCRQFLWGMFTKMCIADNLAAITDVVWADYNGQGSTTLVIVALLYPIQMYADFDGYSNMAIGVGKLLGINITRNFNHPFLARNIAEYWRNWHISLTGWLTDYVFSPLNIAFRNLNNLGIILAVIINFVLIGFWHGANWTFGLFGLYHGLLYIPLVLSGAFGKKKKLKPNTKGLPQFTDFCKMVGTFLLVAFGLVIFRADCISDAINFITGIVTNTFFALPPVSMGKVKLLIVAFLVITMLSLEWSTRNWEYPIQDISFKTLYRWCIYVALTLLILTTAGDQVQFIYFKF